MIRFLEISNLTLFWYYLATNLAYLAMLIIALKTLPDGSCECSWVGPSTSMMAGFS